MTAPPIMVIWDGAVFKPASRHWLSLANKHYGAGQVTNLVEHQFRSRATHSHFFACVHDAWANLPPEQAILFPSAEHLRKWALIKTGWCDTQVFIMADHEQAKALRRTLKSCDGFAVVLAKDNTVTQYVAKSQSLRAMGKQDFQKSKTDCLAAISELLGTTPKALADNSGKSGDGAR